MHTDAAKDTCYTIEYDGNLAVVSLDRPPVNALSQENYGQLAALFEGLGDLDGPDTVLLRSAQQRAFCAGADLTESPATTASSNNERQALSRRLFKAVRHCRIPVVAAIDGPALGAGLALAASCDIRVAGPRAVFGLPEINVGKGGGGRHAMHLVTPGIARLMYFTGRRLDAEQARAAGIVDVPVDDSGDVDAVARELAAEIAGKSPIALRYGKEALLLAERLGVEEGYQAEQQFSMRLAETADSKEAARAFLEKREPHWNRR